ncbi:MAG: penicillin acylase family protein [Lewinellaceae bacterium]|nr:penicillin acylase family protein [Lewinellaceae bacterium]
MRIVKFLAAALLTCVLAVLANTHQPLGFPLPATGPLFSPFTGFWQNADPVETGTDWALPAFPGLHSPARVAYDERMVPHIFALNLHDAAFVQGYVTARDRLWQMDFTTRAAVGRISELIGERALEYDRTQRRKGMLLAAENALKAWSRAPDELEVLEAYSEGVNAYIGSLRPADYPLEFKLMGYAPEAWEPLKCAVFFKFMAEKLCFRSYDIPATNTFNLLGEELFAQLFPEYNPRQSPVIPETVAWDFEKLPLEHETPASPEMMSDLILHRQLPQAPEGIGSNNWAVSGSKTASGRPILCNDPHLELNLPAIWYEVQLSVPGMNSYGVSLPGIPGIIIGFNENIAWGVTNVSHDVLDWYEVKWADKAKETYFYGGEKKAVSYLVEVIKVRGRDKPVLDTVKYTAWGPVVYEGEGPEQDMAMHWVALDAPEDKPFYEIGTFLRLMRGENIDDYTEALKAFESPAQNFVFAGKYGDIAITVNGSLPLKRKEQGRFVQDGSDPDNAWYGFIPRNQIPQVRNPERGFVSSANQNSTGPDYPYYYNGKFDNYRGRYINRRLEEMKNITVEDMKGLQLDNYSILGEEGAPVLLALLDSTASTLRTHPDVEALRQWDFRFDKEKTAPVLFDRWLNEARRLTFDELYSLSDSVEVIIPEKWLLLSLLRNRPDHVIFDLQGTEKRESASDVALLALEEVMKEEPAEDWGAYKNTHIGHLARIEPFSTGFLDVGGFGDAPNAIKETHGPSWRMIVELGDPVQAYGVYPGGQSGNPGSPYYQNMVRQWAAGEYNELFLMYGPGDQRQPVRLVAEFEPGE